MNTNKVTEDEVLSLIISQLVAYGYSAVAQSVADATGASTDMLPSSKLSEMIQFAKYKHDEDDSEDDYSGKTFDHDSPRQDMDISMPSSSGFDIESLQNAQPKTAPDYNQLYYTQHKGPCRTAIFSSDGRFAATGSHDSSLKLLDVNKMKNRSGDAGDKPVIRTLYDHTEQVNDLSFHPNGLVLASCSNDQSIKLFDLSKSGVKRAFRYLQDAQPVNSICFHPSGDFLLAGTKDAAVRIYDVKTLQCYTNSSSADVHRGSVSQIRYSNTGKIFATSSFDGTVRIWDSTSSQCIRTLEGAHGGTAVSSVRFTANEKYLLTAGLDSTIRLWEVTSGNVLMEYKGHEQRTQMLQPSFTYTEGFIVIGDEASTDVVVYDTQTGTLAKRVPGHNNLVRCVAASPVDNGILTCR
ncbi:WD40-repeat-containing domain protein [Gilbertella persicaria]|uniref:WD40-repeat-containing domain protein n=1 Tax=Gilbertella persicaria TaxID=101096 RepID=UPI00221EE34B|nr:WD40-repeat-containing domain protein [Gilbertella persicaria]KAI8059070.1 WD40-repeat-containing domain protein [Gilbertella persicaria]